MGFNEQANADLYPEDDVFKSRRFCLCGHHITDHDGPAFSADASEYDTCRIEGCGCEKHTENPAHDDEWRTVIRPFCPETSDQLRAVATKLWPCGTVDPVNAVPRSAYGL